MKESIIARQIGILQTILNNIAEEDKNGSEDFVEYTNKYFGFENELGWNILINAFYVIEDTELSKQDFREFGLQGPCRHNNTGEKYLRLYGILNSFYQQFLALRNLIELFKLEPKDKYIKQLQESDCINLRNKIAAHSTNYSSDRYSKKFDVFEISRPDLIRGEIRLLKNQNDFETYDLNFAINDFNEKAQIILSCILKKFLKKKFNNQGKNYIEFHKLELLRNGAIEIGD